MSEKRSFWQEINLAIRGTDVDYTTIPLKRAILYLALPMVLEMALESVFVLVDIFFVAKLGADAVAAVGLTDSVVTLVYAIAVGLSVAITAKVARRIGEKDFDRAASTVVQALILGITISIPIAVLGILKGKDILRLMGASSEVAQFGSGYTVFLLGGSATIMLIFVLNAVFRGAGDAVLAMRSLWLANLINIVLDPCLIFGWGPFPELGIKGAAVATTIGRGIGVMFQLWILFRGGSRIKVLRQHMKLNLKTMARLLRVSMGGILQYLIATASWIGVVRIIAIFGSSVLAGYTIAVRILIFSLLPSWGISNSAATLVGQNLGADNPDRAEKAVWKIALVNLVFLGLISLAFIFIPGTLTRIFTSDPEVIPHSIDCLRIIAYGYAFMAYGSVMVHSFNGAGDTYTPSWIYFFCYWVFQIPAAYLLAVPAGMGSRGIFIAILIAESLLAVVAVLAFRKGAWKKHKI